MSNNLITIVSVKELGINKSLLEGYIIKEGESLCGKRMMTYEKLQELKSSKNVKN